MPHVLALANAMLSAASLPNHCRSRPSMVSKDGFASCGDAAFLQQSRRKVLAGDEAQASQGKMPVSNTTTERTVVSLCRRSFALTRMPDCRFYFGNTGRMLFRNQQDISPNYLRLRYSTPTDSGSTYVVSSFCAIDHLMTKPLLVGDFGLARVRIQIEVQQFARQAAFNAGSCQSQWSV